jgi:hypothetical protein
VFISWFSFAGRCINALMREFLHAETRMRPCGFTDAGLFIKLLLINAKPLQFVTSVGPHDASARTIGQFAAARIIDMALE